MEEFKTEKQLVNYLIHRLNAAGNYVWRNNSGIARMVYKGKERIWRAGVRGSSDIIGIAYNGRFIAIECKIGKNKVTPAQEQFLRTIDDLGGYALVARSEKDIAILLGKIIN